jgi:hypothetical protein
VSARFTRVHDYPLLAIALDRFVLSQKGTASDAFLLGVIIYGVYNATNYAIRNRNTVIDNRDHLTQLAPLARRECNRINSRTPTRPSRMQAPFQAAPSAMAGTMKIPASQFGAIPPPSVMQAPFGMTQTPGMWQQMSPLLQADNLALKYDGKIRTAQHQQFLMALADQILNVTDWNSLLSALNGYRMQGVRAMQQQTGPTAVQKQDVKFNGEEAMILSQLVQSGTYDRLKGTPILAMYEYFLTIDDYCNKCAELSEKCVRHLLAVRRQGNAPTTVTVETTEEGRLLPQRMSEEDIARHKEQVPPPDFFMWVIRDLMPKHEKRRFESAQDTSDKLTGLEGPMSPQFECRLTYVGNGANYKAHFSEKDQEQFRDVSEASKIFPKTQYQLCLDEAVLLSHPFYADYIAICEGLFRIHFLRDVRRLHAPDTSAWDVNFTIQAVRTLLNVPDTEVALTKLPERDDKTEQDWFTQNLGTEKDKIPNARNRLANETVSPYGDTVLQPSEYVNGCDSAIVSGSPAGAGMLQPKALPWHDYGDNYIRVVLGLWTGSPARVEKRKAFTQTIPRSGGAIGEYFATYVANAAVMTAAGDNPKTTVSSEIDALRKLQKENAEYARNAGIFNRLVNRIGVSSAIADASVIADSKVVSKDAVWVAAPFGFNGDQSKLKTQLGKVVSQPVSPNGVSVAFESSEVEESQARTRARYTPRDVMWERAAQLKEHPIQHIGNLGRACAKTHFDNWLKRNYLFPLIRIFNEVCTDHMEGELNCPPSTEIYPVVSQGGNLYAAPASQVGILDPTTGRMTYPGAVQDASRCVLPGATPPPPVPGFAHKVGTDRTFAPQVRPTEVAVRATELSALASGTGDSE